MAPKMKVKKCEARCIRILKQKTEKRNQNMNWIEAKIKTEHTEIEELSLRLEEAGIQGLTLEDEKDFQSFLENNRKYWDYIDEEIQEKYKGVSQIKFYVIDNEEGTEKIRELEKNLNKKIETRTISDESWNSWKENYKIIEIGETLQIVPYWIEPENKRKTTLRLDPGMAFGTGYHATTQMCLRVMESLELKDKLVLDIGFGSGILSIAAILFGAKKVVGCDIDPNAITAARENAKLNEIDEEKMELYSGNIVSETRLQKKISGSYQLVAANIVADVILPLIKQVRNYLKTNGLFLCSGIIKERTKEIEQSLEENGYTIKQHLQQEEWNCYLAQYQETTRDR